MLRVFRPGSVSVTLALSACIPALLVSVAHAQTSGSYLITTVNPGIVSGNFSISAMAVDSSGSIYISDTQFPTLARILKITSDGIIHTVAGSGAPGFGGDGGPATAAQLEAWPGGLAADRLGSIFFSDTRNHRIRKISSAGIIDTIAGGGAGAIGGSAKASAIGEPYGLAVDAAGSVYFIAGSYNGNSGTYTGAILKVGIDGIISTVLSPFQFTGSPTLTVDAGGNLYVAGTVERTILKVRPDGTAIVFTPGLNASPEGLTMDSVGNLFYAVRRSVGGLQILRTTPTGATSVIAGGGPGAGGDGGPAKSISIFPPPGDSSPVTIAIDLMGQVYTHFPGGPTIRKLLPTEFPTDGCLYSIDPASRRFDAAGGTFSVGLLANASNCPWLAVTYGEWISTTPVGVSTGSASVTYRVDPNPSSSARSGAVGIGGQWHSVAQDGVGCLLRVDPRSLSVTASGAYSDSKTVTANAADCVWSARANVPWIMISKGNNGVGSGTVSYSVGINTGPLRTGSMTIAGHTVYVNQVGSTDPTSGIASIAADGVVNAAGLQPSIAPGTFVTIYGRNLADSNSSWDSAIAGGRTLPTALSGTRASINGRDCFVAFVSSTQINVLTPADTTSGPVDVDVATNHGTATATVNLAPISPALFAYTLDGTIYPVAVFANSNLYVAQQGALSGSASRPAKSGDYISLFATGLGPTDPPYPSGQVLSRAYPVADLSKVRVSIGGIPASVVYAGMTFAGLFQVNVKVPAGIPNGVLPVVLQIDGQSSQPNAVLPFEP